MYIKIYAYPYSKEIGEGYGDSYYEYSNIDQKLEEWNLNEDLKKQIKDHSKILTWKNE